MGIVALEGFGGGGGASLNFDIKDYATKDLLLAASPKDNTIGVITTTPISSWIFRATEPEAPADGKDGPVWIFTGTSSTAEFNALKKNGIQVYPISAKQYVSGAWVDVTAKSYQNGAWVDWWNGELFDYGDVSFATGGWDTFATKHSVTENSDGSITLKGSGGTVLNTYVTVNAIDLAKYNTLCFAGSIVKSFAWIAVLDESTTSYTGAGTAGELARMGSYYVDTTGTPDSPVTADISKIDKKCRICFASINTINAFTVQKLWLQ